MEPGPAAGLPFEVAEHRDRFARDGGAERVRVVRAADRARAPGGSAGRRRSLDDRRSDAAAGEMERGARAVYAGADHRDLVRLHGQHASGRVSARPILPRGLKDPASRPDTYRDQLTDARGGHGGRSTRPWERQMVGRTPDKVGAAPVWSEDDVDGGPGRPRDLRLPLRAELLGIGRAEARGAPASGWSEKAKDPTIAGQSSATCSASFGEVDRIDRVGNVSDRVTSGR